MVKTSQAVSVRVPQQNVIRCSIRVRPAVEQMSAYIPGESLEAFSQRTGIPLENIIKLNANESPYGPLPAALDALRAHEWYNQYPDTSASLLKEAVSRYTGLETKQIVLGHGSMDLIHLLWHIFLSPGDTLLCCSPTFSFYATAANLCGAVIHNIERKRDYEIDVRAIRAAITPRTKFIVLCSPNNPTGNPIRERDLFDLLDTGQLVILDEAYVEFSSRPAGYTGFMAHYDNLIILRTLSKWAGLAGLRVGYGLFPRWIVPYMQRAQQPFEVNVAGFLAATATLTHLDEARERLQAIIQERARVFDLLARQTYLHPFPSEGNFILARLSDPRVRLVHIQQAMERKGILLRYFPQLDHIHDYLRVTVGLPEHTQQLAEAFVAVREIAGM